MNRIELMQQGRAATRKARIQLARDMADRGCPMSEIVLTLGRNRNTISRYLFESHYPTQSDWQASSDCFRELKRNGLPRLP